MNTFLNSTTAYDTLTENGAISHSSTGKALVDQFGKAGAFQGRTYAEVCLDQAALHVEDPTYGLRFAFYLRAVTRKVYGAEDVTRGQGRRDEALLRILYYADRYPDLFYKYLPYLFMFGRARDIWKLAYYAEVNNVPLDRNKIYAMYASALENEEYSDLAKKYLPKIVARSQAKTQETQVRSRWAAGFASFLGLTPVEYRRLKASGDAHTWQQAISRRQFDRIDFNRIPGHALLGLQKFITKQGLEKVYDAWIYTKTTVPFNGYPYQLANKVNSASRVTQKTLDKQFDTLIARGNEAGGITGNVWCALDTSGSMSSRVADTTAFNICIALGIYFSSLNKGAFHKHVIMFDSKSTVMKLNGAFTEMWKQITGANTAWGDTNFQSVIDEIVRIREKFPNVPLEDFPDTLLVVSDMQFNPAGKNKNTNHEMAKKKLAKVFPVEWTEKFRVIWWDCTGRKLDFPSRLEDAGTFVFSGFDGAILTLLLGGEAPAEGEARKEISMEQAVIDALNQPAFQTINA